eukprot:2030651-Pyramimonas_sp.AAC.1
MSRSYLVGVQWSFYGDVAAVPSVGQLYEADAQGMPSIYYKDGHRYIDRDSDRSTIGYIDHVDISIVSSVYIARLVKCEVDWSIDRQTSRSSRELDRCPACVV